MLKYSVWETESLLPLVALSDIFMPQLAAAQAPTQPSMPAIIPTLAGPANPRTTQWDELCSKKGLLLSWLYVYVLER